jgi:hypothetical protein
MPETRVLRFKVRRRVVLDQTAEVEVEATLDESVWSAKARAEALAEADRGALPWSTPPVKSSYYHARRVHGPGHH